MIVVAGEALVDLLVGPDGSVTSRAGGGPFNTARTIARLGGSATFLGRLSSDRFGEGMRHLLLDDGVALALPEPTEAPTTLAVAELDGRGHARYRFYVDGTSAPQLLAADLPDVAAALGAARRPSALHVGTLGLVLEPSATSLERLVASLPDDVLLMVDPNCRPALIHDLAAYRHRLTGILERADVVKVSDEDLGVISPGVAPERAAEALLEHGVRVVLLTAGAEPATILVPGRTVHVPVPPVAVVDTVGAGDAFGGGTIAWWLASGLGRADLRDLAALEAAVRAGIAVSGMTCERPGASPPTLAEVRARGLDWPA